jgi:hypothetical protein
LKDLIISPHELGAQKSLGVIDTEVAVGAICDLDRKWTCRRFRHAKAVRIDNLGGAFVQRNSQAILPRKVLSSLLAQYPILDPQSRIRSKPSVAFKEFPGREKF